MITVVDYKMGNVGSILNMLKKIGVRAELTSDPTKILEAKAILLPGVGRFDRAMTNLAEMKLLAPLNEAVRERGTKTLGICLGMQIMTNFGEEGSVAGLGWVPGQVTHFRFPEGVSLPVPHMGWTELTVRKPDPLFNQLSDEARFYHVHSYFVSLEDPNDVLAEGDYGVPFVAAFRHRNVVGVQFHPEKSHRYGLQLLTNFVNEVRA